MKYILKDKNEKAFGTVIISKEFVKSFGIVNKKLVNNNYSYNLIK